MKIHVVFFLTLSTLNANASTIEGVVTKVVGEDAVEILPTGATDGMFNRLWLQPTNEATAQAIAELKIGDKVSAKGPQVKNVVDGFIYRIEKR